MDAQMISSPFSSLFPPFLVLVPLKTTLKLHQENFDLAHWERKTSNFYQARVV